MTVTSKRRQIEITRPKVTDSVLLEDFCGSEIEHLNKALSNYMYLQFGHISENWTLHLDHIG